MKAKESLDKVINKARVHFYKPFQVAEILRQHRLGYIDDLLDLESYKNPSKKWRNDVSMRLVGRCSTSSARYQDDLFNQFATPPEVLSELGKVNENGLVEAYIYYRFKEKLGRLGEAQNYLFSAKPNTFSFDNFVSLFESSEGLKRSVDKVYEICVYALFSTIIRALKIEVTLKIGNRDQEVLGAFQDFLESVVGINESKQISIPAKLYRVGATNAADRGLDMWCNFGPAVQVKHLTLTEELAGDVASTVSSDRIIIVCKDAEKQVIELVTNQLDIGDRIQGIVTFSMLSNWYQKCLANNFSEKLGKNLLKDLRNEFNAEFPSFERIDNFLKERGYDQITLSGIWKI